MATAKKLPSGSWRCQVYDYTDSEGKRHYMSFTSSDKTSRGKREAEQMAINFALDKEEYHRRQKEEESKKAGQLTFGEALDKYIAFKTPVLSPRTIYDYRVTRNNHLQSLMTMPINNITAEDVQYAINADMDGHSPKTVYNHHGLVVAVFKMFRPDFAFHTTLPKKVRPALYIPTEEDIKNLLSAAAGTDIELPILLAAFGPMRRGEIAALTSDNISGNTVHVVSTMVLDLNRDWIVKSPKSYAGDRFIEYPDFVAQKWKGISGRITELHPNNITDRFSVLLKKAGIPHFRFHDLRHYCASIQHALGIPDAYIMERGGWGNDTVLKNVYRHTLSDRKQEMNAKANSHFAALVDNATRNATQNKKSL